MTWMLKNLYAARVAMNAAIVPMTACATMPGYHCSNASDAAPRKKPWATA